MASAVALACFPSLAASGSLPMADASVDMARMAPTKYALVTWA